MHYIYLSLLSPDRTPLFTKRLPLQVDNPCISLSSVQNIMKKNGVCHPEFKSETIQINISKSDLVLRFLDPPSSLWVPIERINYFLLRDEELIEKAILKDVDEIDDLHTEKKRIIVNSDIKEYSATKNEQNEQNNSFGYKIKENQLPIVKFDDFVKEKFERERDERREEQKGKEEKSEQRRKEELKNSKKNKNRRPPCFWIKNTGISWKRGQKGRAWIYPGKAYWECRLVKWTEDDTTSQINLNSGLTNHFEKLEIESC